MFLWYSLVYWFKTFPEVGKECKYAYMIIYFITSGKMFIRALQALTFMAVVGIEFILDPFSYPRKEGIENS